MRVIVNTFHQKYSYKEYQNDLKGLQQRYPDLCKIKVIGRSADKRNLYEVILGDTNAKKHFLVIANLHAREYMTTQLCMKQIEYYLKNYDKSLNGVQISAVLKEVAIHYIPSCNPDGTAISQYGFSSIRDINLRRKLKRMEENPFTWKANARGVDLNRNWDIAFQKKGKAGSAGYHGPKASSEPETRALIKWIEKLQKKSTVVGMISYHASGSVLFGRCVDSAAKSVKYQTMRMVRVAEKLTKYTLMPMESIASANGCSREYFLYKKKIPCITIEIGENPCPLKQKEFPSIWKKNKNLVIREAMLFRIR